MKISYLKETTDWRACDHVQPQHIYIVERWTGSLLGYIKNGTTIPFYFRKPMRQWSQTRRKFDELTSAEIAIIEGKIK